MTTIIVGLVIGFSVVAFIGYLILAWALNGKWR